MTEETKTVETAEIKVTLPENVVIVIVEDDRGHYLLTKKCLQNAGINNEIVWLEDGSAALDFFLKELPGHDHKKYIVLLDIRLPKIDGTIVLEKMKQDQRLEDIPVIMLTTSEDRAVANHCYELGCEAHVIKPPGNVLLKAIERVKMRL